uniref:Protein pangolin n=1 Tax=Ascaris lumbricoides TaxID=6252 RepID=A0A0M3I5B5_ASCLU
MGNKSSSHVPSYPRDIHPYYLNPPHLPPGHPLCPGPPLGHPFLPPPFHQSMISLHHPNGTDSGYMTSPADTERWKAHVCPRPSDLRKCSQNASQKISSRRSSK